LSLLADVVSAGQLPSAAWSFKDASSGQPLNRAMTDNNLATAWTQEISETDIELAGSTTLGFVVDLGCEAVLQRVFMTPGALTKACPPSLRLRVSKKDTFPPGETKTLSFLPLTEEWWKIDGIRQRLQAEGKGDMLMTKGYIDLMLQPLTGRYVRIETTTDKPLTWSVAELELYGSTNAAAFTPSDAVVLATNAPPPLRFAAAELRYYIGELTGRPIPVVAPERTNDYPGTLYTIVDLAPLATNWAAMEANRKAGLLPIEEVNVESAGRTVLFRAWPYANVRASVWAFLEQQGVRWLYPDPHGDVVPADKGVNLQGLPLRFTPSATRRSANFDLSAFGTQPDNPAFLFWWRNGYRSSWKGAGAVLGGAEVPPPPHLLCPPAQWPEDYKEGFDGYPHNFNAVVPDRLLKQHPEWWGMPKPAGDAGSGQRRPPWEGGPAPCLTSTGLIAFVTAKAIAITDGPDSTAVLNLLPMDAASFCECPSCRALYEPLEKPALPYCALPTFMASDAYYAFVAAIADGLRATRPHVRLKALAYANVLSPPRKLAKLPDNVIVEVCHYVAPNLPMDASANAAMNACWEEWRRRCDHLEHYDYTLLNENRASSLMPVPLVTALADHARFLSGLGALEGGTQADTASLPYSPWNHYAYPRLLWNADRKAADLLDEFFSGFFREAQAPMRAYCATLEDHLIRRGINLHGGGYSYQATPDAFRYTVLVDMRRHLASAEAAAASWVVKERVARMRQGFEWTLKELGLTAAQLDDPAVFPSVPAEGLALKRMDYGKENAEITKDGDWVFWSQGVRGSYLHLEQDGKYAITISARGKPDEQIDPVMTVYLGRLRAGSAAVTPGEYKDYTFHVSGAEAGIGLFQIQYFNAAPGGRRNLFIKSVRINRE
jgi:hypothetical protein